MKKAFQIRNSVVSTIIFVFASLALMTSQATAGNTKAAESMDGALIVNFDDLLGHVDPNIEWIRENLLETAFYEASRRTKLANNYVVEYNGSIPKLPKNLLNLRIVEWRRSPTNFYEFRAIATYYDADGKATKLGTVSGTRSGLSVFNRYDVGEHFADAAEDAIKKALKKLETIS